MQFKLHTPTKLTSRVCTRAVQATHANKMNVSCMHVCSSSYTRQQNERLVHARVQFPMVIRHRSVVRTWKMLRAFLKTCRAVQLLHACVVKFKVSGTVATFTILHLYDGVWADQRLTTVLKSFVNQFTNGCNTVMY